MGSSLIQFTILLLSLWLMSTLQHKRQSRLPKASESIVKKKNNSGWLIVFPALIFAILPLITLVISSFRIRESSASGTTYSWSTAGWEYAFTSTNSLPSAWDALFNSVGYALVALVDRFASGLMLAQYICDLEKVKPRLARMLDVFTMLPFAVSSVMIGLGVMLGMIRIDAEFFYFLYG